MNPLLKRAYEPASPNDGCRVLVDRLWPRGVSKSAIQIDLWLKEVAPSPALRQWFGHEVANWEEFQRLYRQELREEPEELNLLREHIRQGPVTLVYGAKDESHNHAMVLRDYLLES